VSAAVALDALEPLQAEVVARLRALAARVPPARAFARSALDDHARLSSERAEVRRGLGLEAAAAQAVAEAPDLTLSGLRQAQDALVYAHAEALPELGDPAAVDRLARHLVDLSRHLTLIDLWIQAEEQRG
jgi:hypothetical protein